MSGRQHDRGGVVIDIADRTDDGARDQELRDVRPGHRHSRAGLATPTDVAAGGIRRGRYFGDDSGAVCDRARFAPMSG